MNKWFLIYCKPKQETRAEINLSRQGFTVFRPSVQVINQKPGYENSAVCESLFPRYLFVQVDPDIKSIAPIVSTLGVSCFVKFGDRYAIASEALISEIKSNIGNKSVLVGSSEAIKKGDEIYVDGHGFDQVKAIYCNPCGNMRAIILLNILGKEARIIVPNECMSKILY
ncbi:MAG: transcription/translation regulatory transformer protein RfaH [Pseudomonadota bacterium]